MTEMVKEPIYYLGWVIISHTPILGLGPSIFSASDRQDTCRDTSIEFSSMREACKYIKEQVGLSG